MKKKIDYGWKSKINSLGKKVTAEIVMDALKEGFNQRERDDLMSTVAGCLVLQVKQLKQRNQELFGQWSEVDAKYQKLVKKHEQLRKQLSNAKPQTTNVKPSNVKQKAK